MNFDGNLPLAERLRLGADRICAFILYSDLDRVDIQIQANRLRELCRSGTPEKIELFDAIYAGRFERLWEQWREGTRHG